MLGLTGRRSFVEVERWEKDAGAPGTGEDKIIVKQWKGKQGVEFYFLIYYISVGLSIMILVKDTFLHC